MYQNPFGMYSQQYQQNIIRVHGMDGAKAYQLQPNSSVILLDEADAIIYVKTTDGAGFPSITTFDLIEHKSQEEIQNKNFEERLKKLEQLYESHFESNKQPENEQPT